MLLRIDPGSAVAERIHGAALRDIGLDERGLQAILFESLDRLIPDEELLVIAQSRRWQEEPDLLALDQSGRLFIFEIKAWESSPSNLLQALRYGQILGTQTYDDLARRFAQSRAGALPLEDAHAARFGVRIPREEYNHEQVFVVLTNGLDVKTREAARYWKKAGLDVRPWVYRAYHGLGSSPVLEISPFRVEDDPYEDVLGGAYILNTNYQNSPEDHEYMLREERAAAFFSPPKKRIERLGRGDWVFLYQTGVGIVAYGRATGRIERRPYHGLDEYPDEEYSTKLERFRRIDPPLAASEINELLGTNYKFRGTMFSIGREAGAQLRRHVESARGLQPK